MSGVSLAGGFVVLEDGSDEEKALQARWMDRHFPHLRADEPTREERLADLAGPGVATMDDGGQVDAIVVARFPGTFR